MVSSTCSSAFRRLRQEDCFEFKISLGYRASLRPSWTMEKDPIPKNQTKTTKQRKRKKIQCLSFTAYLSSNQLVHVSRVYDTGQYTLQSISKTKQLCSVSCPRGPGQHAGESLPCGSSPPWYTPSLDTCLGELYKLCLIFLICEMLIVKAPTLLLL